MTLIRTAVRTWRSVNDLVASGRDCSRLNSFDSRLVLDQNAGMQPLPRLPKLPRKLRHFDERCGICGCRLHRAGGYALPTPEGRSHATEHHYVAERFFGRSSNRKHEHRDRVFESCPWNLEGQSGTFCYECHEELLHNPVLTRVDIKRFAALVQPRGLNEDEKTASREKLSGRIQLLHAVIAAGLNSLEE